MNCSEFREHQSDYLDGTLAESVRAETEVHLVTCKSCQRRADQLHRLNSFLERLPWETAPAVLERLVQHHVARYRPWSWRRTLRDAWQDISFSLRHMDRRLVWSKLAAFPVTFCFFLSILASFEVGHSVSYDVYPLMTDLSLDLIEHKSQASMSEGPLQEWIESTRKIEGDDAMTVLAVISLRGSTSINNVVDYPRNGKLFEAVRRNVSFTHIQPALYNGRPVRSYLILSFFKIDVVG